MPLIDTMKRLAHRLYWCRRPLILCSFCCAGLFAYIVLSEQGIASDDRYLLPVVTLLLWSITATAYLYTFVHVPEAPTNAVGFFRRLGIRLKRFYYLLLALVTIALTLAVLFVSMRAARLYLFG